MRIWKDKYKMYIIDQHNISTGGGIPTNGLIAEYLFSNNLTDTSGNGYNLTDNNMAFGTDRHAVSNAAGYFNGTDGYCYYLNLGSSEDLLTSDFSLSFWLNPAASIANNKAIISYGDIAQTSKYWSFRRYGGNLYYVVYWNSGLSIPVATWTHFVFTYDYSERDLYVYKNDTDIASNLNLNFSTSAGKDLTIGYFNSGNVWKGYIDDFRIYNRILTSDEITALYNE
jgi:hypothetical protein